MRDESLSDFVTLYAMSPYFLKPFCQKAQVGEANFLYMHVMLQIIKDEKNYKYFVFSLVYF